MQTKPRVILEPNEITDLHRCVHAIERLLIEAEKMGYEGEDLMDSLWDALDEIELILKQSASARLDNRLVFLPRAPRYYCV